LSEFDDGITSYAERAASVLQEGRLHIDIIVHRTTATSGIFRKIATARIDRQAGSQSLPNSHPATMIDGH
jgi:hypothetical protein